MCQIYQSIRFILIALSATLLVVACQPAAVDQPTGVTADCRIVNHELGETQICGQPQKVAVISPRILDSMLALGVQPTAFAQAVRPGIEVFDNPTEQIPYIGKWVTTQPIGLGSRNTPSLERLKQLQPDLIMGEPWQSGFSKVMNQIAPTLFFNDAQDPNEIGSWQQDITEIARALGKEEAVNDVLAQHEAQIARARAALQPVLKAYPRISLITANVEMTQLKSGFDTSLARLLEEIGFEVLLPPGYTGNSSIALSWEIIPSIDSDLMIVAAWDSDLALNPEDSTPQNSMRDQWAQNPLLNSMPTFQQGRVIFVDYYLSGGVTRGPLSDQVILESLPDLLLRTVKAA
ncbi:MAG: ABC transporter substrate-binding protein [Cyanobacteria bacterium J06555_13]